MGAAASFFNGSITDEEVDAHGKPTSSAHASTSNRPDASHHSASAPIIPTLGGAAAGYITDIHSSSLHNESTTSPLANAAQYSTSIYNGSQPPSLAHSTAYSSHSPPKPGKTSSHSSNIPLYAAGAGLVAAAYGSNHHSSTQHAPSIQQHSSTPMMHRHRHHGPLGALVDFFKDAEGVAKFEEYSEYVGICRYCFEPGSSPRDAPRKHRAGRRRSGDRYGSSNRVDKDSRYNSSENEGHRKKDKSWIATGLAGYGLAKVGESLFKKRNDFDDTPSVKSGRVSPSGKNQMSKKYPDGNSRRPHHSDDRLENGSLSNDKRYQNDVLAKASADSSFVSYSKENRQSRPESIGRQSVGTGAYIGPGVEASLEPSISGRRRRSSENVKPKSQEDTLAHRHEKHKKKKKGGLFNLRSGSSSASSVDLSYNVPQDKSRRSKKTKTGKDEDRKAEAALLGLGAAAAALALNEDRANHKKKNIKGLVAVKETNGNARRSSRHKRSARSSASSEEETWESASGGDISSVDSALAFGALASHGSQESLSSAASGTDKWDWRWGSKKSRRDAPNKRLSSGNTNLLIGEAGTHADNVSSVMMSPEEYQGGNMDSTSVPALQHVYPVPTSDPGHFDVQRERPIAEQPVVATRMETVPIQHPQPVTPVSSSLYSAQPRDNSRSYSLPTGVPILSSSPPQIQPIKHYKVPVADQKSQIDALPNEATSDFRLRRRDTSPARFSEDPTSSTIQTQRHPYAKDDSYSVHFHLTEEQEDKARKERRRRRKEEDKLSGHSDSLSRDNSSKKITSDPQHHISDQSSNHTGGITAAAALAGAAVGADMMANKSKNEETRDERRERRRRERDHEDQEAAREKSEQRRRRRQRERSLEDDTSVSKSDRHRPKEHHEDKDVTSGRNQGYQDPVPEVRKEKSVWQEAAAAKISTHEDYQSFFMPLELINKSTDETKTTSSNPDADIDLGHSPAIVTIEPKGARNRSGSPIYSPADTEDKIDVSKLSFPWQVPRLKLVEPTPPSSRGSTPVFQPRDSNNDVPEKSSKVATPSKVTWADEQIHEYDDAEPLEQDGLVKTAPQLPRHEEVASQDSELQSRTEHSNPGNDIKSGDRAKPFADDYEFAATLAAGAEEAGFDGSIIIDEPSYRRRDSPPGSNGRTLPGTFEDEEPKNTKREKRRKAQRTSRKDKPDFVEERDDNAVVEDIVRQVEQTENHQADAEIDNGVAQEEWQSASKSKSKKSKNKSRARESEPQDNSTQDSRPIIGGSMESSTRFQSAGSTPSMEPTQFPDQARESRKKSQRDSIVDENANSTGLSSTSPGRNEETPSPVKRGSLWNRILGKSNDSVARDGQDPDETYTKLDPDIPQELTKESENSGDTELSGDVKDGRHTADGLVLSSESKVRKDIGRNTQDLPIKVYTPALPGVSPKFFLLIKDKGSVIGESSGFNTHGPSAHNLEEGDVDEYSQEPQIESFLGVRPEPPPPPDTSERTEEPGGLSCEKAGLINTPSSSSVPDDQRKGPSDLTCEAPSADIITSSPTAVPFHFRRPAPSSPFTRSASQTPVSSPWNAVDLPFRQKPRPRSTEFKSSKEFRPLWLVERHRSHQEPAPEDVYPSLPSSHTTSRASSVHGPDESTGSEMTRLGYEQNELLEDRHGMLIDADTQHTQPDLLDSQQATPTASSFLDRASIKEPLSPKEKISPPLDEPSDSKEIDKVSGLGIANVDASSLDGQALNSAGRTSDPPEKEQDESLAGTEELTLNEKTSNFHAIEGMDDGMGDFIPQKPAKSKKRRQKAGQAEKQEAASLSTVEKTETGSICLDPSPMSPLELRKLQEADAQDAVDTWFQAIPSKKEVEVGKSGRSVGLDDPPHKEATLEHVPSDMQESKIAKDMPRDQAITSIIAAAERVEGESQSTPSTPQRSSETLLQRRQGKSKGKKAKKGRKSFQDFETIEEPLEQEKTENTVDPPEVTLDLTEGFLQDDVQTTECIEKRELSPEATRLPQDNDSELIDGLQSASNVGTEQHKAGVQSDSAEDVNATAKVRSEGSSSAMPENLGLEPSDEFFEISQNAPQHSPSLDVKKSSEQDSEVKADHPADSKSNAISDTQEISHPVAQAPSSSNGPSALKEELVLLESQSETKEIDDEWSGFGKQKKNKKGKKQKTTKLEFESDKILAGERLDIGQTGEPNEAPAPASQLADEPGNDAEADLESKAKGKKGKKLKAAKKPEPKSNDAPSFEDASSAATAENEQIKALTKSFSVSEPQPETENVEDEWATFGMKKKEKKSKKQKKGAAPLSSDFPSVVEDGKSTAEIVERAPIEETSSSAVKDASSSAEIDDRHRGMVESLPVEPVLHTAELPKQDEIAAQAQAEDVAEFNISEKDRNLSGDDNEPSGIFAPSIEQNEERIRTRRASVTDVSDEQPVKASKKAKKSKKEGSSQTTGVRKDQPDSGTAYVPVEQAIREESGQSHEQDALVAQYGVDPAPPLKNDSLMPSQVTASDEVEPGQTLQDNNSLDLGFALPKSKKAKKQDKKNKALSWDEEAISNAEVAEPYSSSMVGFVDAPTKPPNDDFLTQATDPKPQSENIEQVDDTGNLTRSMPFGDLKSPILGDTRDVGEANVYIDSQAAPSTIAEPLKSRVSEEPLEKTDRANVSEISEETSSKSARGPEVLAGQENSQEFNVDFKDDMIYEVDRREEASQGLDVNSVEESIAKPTEVVHPEKLDPRGPNPEDAPPHGTVESRTSSNYDAQSSMSWSGQKSNDIDGIGTQGQEKDTHLERDEQPEVFGSQGQNRDSEMIQDVVGLNRSPDGVSQPVEISSAHNQDIDDEPRDDGPLMRPIEHLESPSIESAPRLEKAEPQEVAELRPPQIEIGREASSQPDESIKDAVGIVTDNDELHMTTDKPKPFVDIANSSPSLQTSLTSPEFVREETTEGSNEPIEEVYSQSPKTKKGKKKGKKAQKLGFDETKTPSSLADTSPAAEISAKKSTNDSMLRELDLIDPSTKTEEDIQAVENSGRSSFERGESTRQDTVVDSNNDAEVGLATDYIPNAKKRKNEKKKARKATASPRVDETPAETDAGLDIMEISTQSLVPNEQTSTESKSVSSPVMSAAGGVEEISSLKRFENEIEPTEVVESSGDSPTEALTGETTMVMENPSTDSQQSPEIERPEVAEPKSTEAGSVTISNKETTTRSLSIGENVPESIAPTEIVEPQNTSPEVSMYEKGHLEAMTGAIDLDRAREDELSETIDLQSRDPQIQSKIDEPSEIGPTFSSKAFEEEAIEPGFNEVFAPAKKTKKNKRSKKTSSMGWSGSMKSSSDALDEGSQSAEPINSATAVASEEAPSDGAFDKSMRGASPTKKSDADLATASVSDNTDVLESSKVEDDDTHPDLPVKQGKKAKKGRKKVQIAHNEPEIIQSTQSEALEAFDDTRDTATDALPGHDAEVPELNHMTVPEANDKLLDVHEQDSYNEEYNRELEKQLGTSDLEAVEAVEATEAPPNDTPISAASIEMLDDEEQKQYDEEYQKELERQLSPLNQQDGDASIADHFTSMDSSPQSIDAINEKPFGGPRETLAKATSLEDIAEESRSRSGSIQEQPLDQTDAFSPFKVAKRSKKSKKGKKQQQPVIWEDDTATQGITRESTTEAPSGPVNLEEPIESHDTKNSVEYSPILGSPSLDRVATRNHDNSGDYFSMQSDLPSEVEVAQIRNSGDQRSSLPGTDQAIRATLQTDQVERERTIDEDSTSISRFSSKAIEKAAVDDWKPVSEGLSVQSDKIVESEAGEPVREEPLPEPDQYFDPTVSLQGTRNESPQDFSKPQDAATAKIDEQFSSDAASKGARVLAVAAAGAGVESLSSKRSKKGKKASKRREAEKEVDAEKESDQQQRSLAGDQSVSPSAPIQSLDTPPHSPTRSITAEQPSDGVDLKADAGQDQGINYRDSAIHFPDSPAIPEPASVHRTGRDSGYPDTEVSPVIGGSPVHQAQQINNETFEPLDEEGAGSPTPSNEHQVQTSPLDKSVEWRPNEIPIEPEVKPKRRRRSRRKSYDSDDSADSGFDIQRRRRRLQALAEEPREPSPVSSTTKDRSSALFDSSSSAREELKGQYLEEAPRSHGHSERSVREVISDQESSSGIGTTRATGEDWTFRDIPADISDQSRSGDEKSTNVDGIASTPYSPAKSDKQGSQMMQEDGGHDIEAPLWPSRSSDKRSDISERSQSRNTDEMSSQLGNRAAIAGIPMSPRDGFSRPAGIGSPDSIRAIIRTPEQVRSASGQSFRSSGTPPLRRVDRSVSGDLRGASRLSEAKSRAKLVQAEAADVSSIPSSSTYDPVTDKGKKRADMADFVSLCQ